MSQYDFGTIDPYVDDGVTLADMLNNWRDAVHSWHRGAGRPSYAVPGMLWINDAGGPTNWLVYAYLGPAMGDILLWTYDTTTGAITVGPAAQIAAATLMAQGNVNPMVRWLATGNAADQKHFLAYEQNDGALRFSAINDAGAEQGAIIMRRDGKLIADISQATGISAGVYVGIAPPAVPTPNQQWWKSDEGRLYIYYDDGTSQQWVPSSPPVAISPGTILQVQSALKTDTFISAATAYTDVPGLSVTLTPRNANSRFRIDVALGIAVATATYGASFQILRNGVPINNAPVAGARPRGNFNAAIASNTDHPSGTAYHTVDVPALAVPLTYKLQVATQNGSMVFINRSQNDSDGADPYQARATSNFTVMEVAG